jgi:hypothetical protein
LGLFDNAVSHLEKALAVHGSIQDSRGETLDCLIMDIAALTNDRSGADADAFFRRPLEISREIGDIM